MLGGAQQAGIVRQQEDAAQGQQTKDDLSHTNMSIIRAVNTLVSKDP